LSALDHRDGTLQHRRKIIRIVDQPIAMDTEAAATVATSLMVVPMSVLVML
jgi:hypothetical protein